MSTEIAVEIGRALRRARRSKGLTLRQVGERSGGELRPTAVAGYERGERNISLERFLRLARVYGIPPGRLMAEIARRVDELPPVVIDVTAAERLGTTEGLLVADFVHEVRSLRLDEEGETITLRGGDLEVLATASGQRPEQLSAKIAPALKPSGRGTEPGRAEPGRGAEPGRDQEPPNGSGPAEG